MMTLLARVLYPSLTLHNGSAMAEPLWANRKHADMMEIHGARGIVTKAAGEDREVPLSAHVKRATETCDHDEAEALAAEALAFLNGDSNGNAPAPAVVTHSGQDPLSLAVIRELFDKWLVLPDGERRYDQIDIALAVVVANRLPFTHPLWMLIVAPPSNAKTEVIQSLWMAPDVYELSSLTPQTLISGYANPDDPNHDASLLPKLNNKTLLMKDFTSILVMRHEPRGEILGQLREIYDGAYSKAFGTGREFKWHGKVGLLAGVTSIVDREFALMTALGERFLMYRIPTVDARTVARRAIKRQTKDEKQKRNLLGQGMRRYLEMFSQPDMREVPETMIEGFSALAEYVAEARAATIYGADGDISFIAPPEGPARLVQQLTLLARALAVVRQEPMVSQATFRTIANVAYDTVPATRQQLLELAVATQQGIDAKSAANVTGYSENMTRRYLKGLVAVRLLEQRQVTKSTDRFLPSERLRELMHDVASAAETPSA